MLTSITTSQFTRTPALPHAGRRALPKAPFAPARAARARRGSTSCAPSSASALEMFTEPTDGMFIWARLPNIATIRCALAEIRSERRRCARAWRRLSTASRTIALDAIQRGHQRRPSHRALARTTVGKSAISEPQTVRLKGLRLGWARQIEARHPHYEAICAVHVAIRSVRYLRIRDVGRRLESTLSGHCRPRRRTSHRGGYRANIVRLGKAGDRAKALIALRARNRSTDRGGASRCGSGHETDLARLRQTHTERGRTAQSVFLSPSRTPARDLRRCQNDRAALHGEARLQLQKLCDRWVRFASRPGPLSGGRSTFSGTKSTEHGRSV